MSQRLPALKPKEVLRALKRAGFFIHHSKRSHYFLKHADKPQLRVTLPYHNTDLKRRTLQSIIEQSGLSVEEFMSCFEIAICDLKLPHSTARNISLRRSGVAPVEVKTSGRFEVHYIGTPVESIPSSEIRHSTTGDPLQWLDQARSPAAKLAGF